LKAATSKEIKTELQTLSPKELMNLCLRLARFKKENKELLTYLLYESENESGYVQSIKTMIDEDFNSINSNSFYYMKKSVRKTLRQVKKFIRYSPSKETEVELLIYFCEKLKTLKPSIKYNVTLTNLFNRQLEMARKRSKLLHEDLQFDYGEEIDELSF